MATPTALTDVVTLVAVLLGSFTAGMMLMRGWRNASGAGAPTSARSGRSRRPLPRMLGGDIFNRYEADSRAPVDMQPPSPPAARPRRRFWPYEPR